MVNDEIISSTHTTPDAIELNALLKQMVDEGCTHCFMEVSSHAVVQHRITGLDFAGGVFSNITHEHLDYHKTFDEYISAKKNFFDSLGNRAFALTNADDKNGKVMLQNTKASKYSYGLKSAADYKAKIIENRFTGLQLNIDGIDVWFKLVGSFNAYNLLAIYSTASLLGEDKTEVLKILSGLEAVEGRFDHVRSSNGIIAIIDYAHTPDALENVLKTISAVKEGNEEVITVVGCGGDRDKTKRPVMAEIACNYSNKVIITSDNPRSENPETIIEEMMKGVDVIAKKKVLNVVNRKEAIRTACMLTKPGDIILLAGKGHEKYQEIKGVKYPFDDKQVIKEIFEQLK
jgi:UDP-N-acetylmuramoyl-L-alanyl-D-glutamate--2,6-diaminopimelate ligase